MFFEWLSDRTSAGSPISWHEMVGALILVMVVRPGLDRLVTAYFSFAARWYAQRAVWRFLSGDFTRAQHFSRKAARAATQADISSREMVALVLFMHGKHEEAVMVIGRAAQDDVANRAAARRFFERIGLYYPTRF